MGSTSAFFFALGLFGASFLALSSRASAEETPTEEKPTGDEPATDSATEEPAPTTVRVSGSKRPRSASQTTVERDVIGAAPHRTASDTLAVLPGVAITQHSGQGKAHQIFFRGFDAAHGQDVEISVAGVPVNEVSNLHGQGYADLHFVMPEVVHRIESLPGTYDVEQGDFAVAGSIRLTLGLDEPGFTATGSAGMFGERRIFLAYSPPSAGPETFAAFEGQASSGFGPSRAARRISTIGQLGLDIGDVAHLRLMASVYAATFDSAGVVVLDDVERGAIDLFDTYDPKQGGDSVRVQVLAEVSQLGSADTRDRWSLAPFFVARYLKLRHNFTGFLVDPQNGDNTQQINEAKTVGATARYTRRFDWLSPSDQVSMGAYVRTDFVDQAQVRLSPVDDHVTSRLVDAEILATNIAGWLDAEVLAFDRLRLRAGVRVDGLFFQALDKLSEDAGAVRSSLGFHIGPRASVDCMIIPGLNAVASFGMGFRSPQARSLADGETTPFTEVISAEGGVRYGSGVLALKAAAFHTRLSSDLVFDETVARNEPVPSSERTGFTADVTTRPVSWMTSSASITYTRAAFTDSSEEFHEGDLVPYAPQLVARADLVFSPRLGSLLNRAFILHAGGALSYFGMRPLPFSEMGHDALVVDTSLGLRWQEAEIRADVFNLLDARWFDSELTYASSFNRGASPSLLPRRHVTAGAPFTFIASASLHL